MHGVVLVWVTVTVLVGWDGGVVCVGVIAWSSFCLGGA